ncbi:inositol monophosphatase family protein [Puniceicoccus vermicola]|uniref:Inositol monophosphatase n=1 Tax=Puniceicoccus vermicola TaxID=388746 RepID=A0A7X1B1V9_9BACT|nr:inositol monophosphatase [Puniceicoccus vermicola]MBC2604106.1 inositol monophosphatase [Puniceicoccus vermicola]
MSEVSQEMARRIEKGTEWVRREIPFFRDSFASVDSEWKVDRSRVTEADHGISDRILAGIEESFPDDDGCSEESGQDGKRELKARFSWVLDPVDGTNNFAIGLPNCAISLALLENGFPVYGWVYDYAGNRLIHGGAGRGLFEEDRPLKPRPPEAGGHTPIGLQFPIPEAEVERLTPLMNRERVRSLGSGTMEGVYVALGFLEGAIDYRVKVWDIAAFMAFFPETQTVCRFLGESPFPLRSFDPEMEATPYMAGTEEFFRRMESIISFR